MDRNELEEIIKLCWDTASNVPLKDANGNCIGPGIIRGIDTFGQGMMDQLRLQLFTLLIHQLVPQRGIVHGFSETRVEQVSPKEPWQGEGGE